MMNSKTWLINCSIFAAWLGPLQMKTWLIIAGPWRQVLGELKNLFCIRRPPDRAFTISTSTWLSTRLLMFDILESACFMKPILSTRSGFRVWNTLRTLMGSNVLRNMASPKAIFSWEWINAPRLRDSDWYDVFKSSTFYRSSTLSS